MRSCNHLIPRGLFCFRKEFSSILYGVFSLAVSVNQILDYTDTSRSSWVFQFFFLRDPDFSDENRCFYGIIFTLNYRDHLLSLLSLAGILRHSNKIGDAFHRERLDLFCRRCGNPFNLHVVAGEEDNRHRQKLASYFIFFGNKQLKYFC